MQWNAKIEALRNVDLEVLDLVKKRTSTDCGRRKRTSIRRARTATSDYWYPGEPALLRKLDRRLEELYGKGSSKIGMEPPSPKK